MGPTCLRCVIAMSSTLALAACGSNESGVDSPLDAEEGSALAGDEQAGGSAEKVRRGHPMLRLDENGDGIVQRAEFQAGHVAMFDDADADADGILQAEELSNLHPKKGHKPGKGPRPDKESRFQETDSNGDGLLSETEVKAAVKARHAEKQGERDGRRSADEIANARWEHMLRADENGDGLLAKSELSSHRGPKGKHGKKGKDFMLKRADENGDGALSRSEFVAAGDAMFARMDKDASGALEASELTRGPREGRGRHGPGKGAPKGAAL